MAFLEQPLSIPITVENAVQATRGTSNPQENAPLRTIDLLNLSLILRRLLI